MSLSAGLQTFKNKSSSVLCFNKIDCHRRYCFKKSRDTFIKQYFKITAFNDIVAAIIQLIQSQPQAGTASTITCKKHP